jgi:hypothetical protein
MIKLAQNIFQVGFIFPDKSILDNTSQDKIVTDGKRFLEIPEQLQNFTQIIQLKGRW